MAGGPPSGSDPAGQVERTYLVLTLLTTLAQSFIWGINTIFLLDAGLDNAEAFTANAFFTVGQVLFEIPTGVVADTRGRRFSYLLGAATLMGSTLLYLVMWQIHAPLWGWAIASILLGLGFTFFSGATEAWLVDALAATGFRGHLEHVFGRAQTVSGVAMLIGTVSGGFIAQATNLGVPYILRAGILGIDAPGRVAIDARPRVHPAARSRAVHRREGGHARRHRRRVRQSARAMADAGRAVHLRRRIFVFYASQPYLLQLYGDPTAYGVAGLAAVIVAGAQIVGGLLVSRSATSSAAGPQP